MSSAEDLSASNAIALAKAFNSGYDRLLRRHAVDPLGAARIGCSTDVSENARSLAVLTFRFAVQEPDSSESSLKINYSDVTPMIG